ncbi:uncharacterized protein LOC142334209 isoform X2 [Lycorma delicatula]|uniref:uncharacterized protein LOC142334209 isoform X2 n=1 Tax=Lycorma delicatula TaxID=130591 RepID=UPI003F514BBF
MATPYVVQTPPLGRACTSTQEYNNLDGYGKTLRQYCREHSEHLIDDNHVNCTLENGQCRLSYRTWCSICENRVQDKPLCLGRRRCRSESTERERTHNIYQKVMQEDCDRSFRTVREYNLRSGSNYHERFRNKISRKDNSYEYFDSPSVSNKQIYGGYSYFDELKHTSPQNSSLRNGSCRQLLGSCENHVELDRNLYFSKKCISESKCCKVWSKASSSDIMQEQDDRYMREMEMLRSKLRELKEGAQDGKRLRQFSESECFPCGQDVCTKRARDNSPHIKPILATIDLPVNPTMLVPRIPRPNIPSSEEATSVSSDSEFADSACDDDEEEVKEEPEVYNEETTKHLLPMCISSSSVSCSNSPSHIVGDTLGLISLSDSSLAPVSSASVSKPFTTGARSHVCGDNIHPGLRPSLFSFVPPYINFSNHEEKGVPFPQQIQTLLKWKMSRITPVIVRRIILNSGFKLVRKSNEWCGTWGKHMKSLCFKTLRDFQKMNHFPGSFQIGRKDNLWKNLCRLMTKFGKKEFGFMPRTYVLPQDNKSLRTAWEKHCGKERWIVKPPASARGTGIKVIHKWAQIPKKCPLIVQKYISDPYLINGSKFDLRLYALVTSINPLRVYLYDNGLVRFASVKYSSELSTLVDRYMHLTNYSINKLSSQYTHNEDAGACQGHKWTLKALWAYLEKEKGVDVNRLWAHMVDLVIKTMISGESSITQLSRAHLTSRYCSYELFGVDILLDQDLKPWLLEVNISPSLHSSTPLDMAVKGPMVQDLMNIAGYQIPNKLSAAQQEMLFSSLGVQDTFCYDKRLYTILLSPAERSKHSEYQQMETRDKYVSNILEDLTPDDVRHLIQYEDEVTQLGNFQKIFPTANTYHYMQFFEAPRYYNMLFDAWETQFHNDRSKGVQLLENLCQKQVHLEVNYAQVKRTKVSMNHTCPPPVQAQEGQEEEEEGVEETDEDEGRMAEGINTYQPNKPREQQWTLSATALCRAARSRSGKPGVVTKPFPRSSYITRRISQLNQVQDKSPLQTKS